MDREFFPPNPSRELAIPGKFDDVDGPREAELEVPVGLEALGRIEALYGKADVARFAIRIDA